MKKIIITSLLALLGLTNFASAYQNKNGQIVDEKNNNEVVEIKGINWSGFQDTDFVDQLGNETSIPFHAFPKHDVPELKGIGIINLLKNPQDFSNLTGVTANNSVSFKTIRLPINPTNLDNSDPLPENRLNKKYVDSTNPTAGNGVFCHWQNNSCNYMSVTDSLYKLIGELGKNKIRVLVDFHQENKGYRTGNVYNLDKYQQDVATLAKAIEDNKLDNVVGIDVFNEPYNLFWFQPNNGQPAWAEVIARAAKAVYANEYTRSLMLFVEGPSSGEQGTKICMKGKYANIPVNEGNYGTAYYINNSGCGNEIKSIHLLSNYGENFQALLDKNEAFNGNPKFGEASYEGMISLRDYLLSTSKLDVEIVNWLLGKPGDPTHAGAHIVFSPHLYGKHVATWQSSQEISKYRFDWNFGFLQDANYPVVIGETGYLLSQPDDIAFFNNSVSYYLKEKEKTAKKGINHNLFYWTFNSSSGDTGGVAKCPKTGAEKYATPCADDLSKSVDSAKLVVEKETALHNLFSGDAINVNLNIQLKEPKNSLKKNK
jgi:hypothetical protein